MCVMELFEFIFVGPPDGLERLCLRNNSSAKSVELVECPGLPSEGNRVLFLRQLQFFCVSDLHESQLLLQRLL